jgi:hypothetical protein
MEQFWPFEEISIFSSGGQLGWRAWLSDTILKGTDPGTIPASQRRPVSKMATITKNRNFFK